MQTKYGYALLAVLSTALLLTTSAAAQQNDHLDSWPQWAKDAMEKEQKRLKFRVIETPDAKFRTKMPGKLAAPEDTGNGWYFHSDIKAGSPLECYHLTEAPDLAMLTNIFAESAIEAAAENNNGTIGNPTIFHTEAGAINGIPYLALEWTYTIESDEQVLLGFTKVRVATKSDAAYACLHSYLGYRETFARVFSTFVENAQDDVTTPSSYYEEISLIDLNGVGSGISYVTFSIDEDGDTKMRATESMIVPVDASTLKTSDSATVSYSMPDGSLINTYFANREDGEIISELTLEQGDAGDWISSGTLQGKSIDVNLGSTRSPTTAVAQLALVSEMFASTDTSVSMDVWVPSIDPTQFLASEITRDDTEIEGHATVAVGPIGYLGWFDEYGNMLRSKVNIGPIIIEYERIWSRGSLKK